MATYRRRLALIYLSLGIGIVLGFSYLAGPHKVFDDPSYQLVNDAFTIKVWGALMLSVSTFGLAATVGRTWRHAFYALTALSIVEIVFSVLLTYGIEQDAIRLHAPVLGFVSGGIDVALGAYTMVAAFAALDNEMPHK